MRAFLILIVFYLFSEVAVASEFVPIRIIGTEGSPLHLPSLETQWQPIVSGMVLAENSLVQVRQGEKITLLWRAGEAQQGHKLEIDFPFMFRATAALFRDIKILSRQMSDYKDLLKKNEIPKDSEAPKPFYDMTSAWTWGTFQENIKVTEAAAETSWFKIQFEKLVAERRESGPGAEDVVRPLAGETVPVKQFPAGVEVRLSNKMDQFPYEVYFWRQVNNRNLPSKPTALIDSQFFSVPTFEAGQYNLTLRGADGQFSKLKTFNVASQATAERSMLQPPVNLISKLLQPSDHSVWITPKENSRAAIPFNFKLREPLAARDFQIVFVDKQSGKKKYQTALPKVGHNLKLPEGSWAWRVQEKAGPAVSKYYHLEVDTRGAAALKHYLRRSQAFIQDIFLLP